jgi:formylglycine-generating enzyme required for sulfatase activity
MPRAMATLAIVMALVASQLVASPSISRAFGVVAPAAAEPRPPVPAARLALLIANGDYRAPDTHATLPSRNAHSLADELRHAGFSVDLHENLGRDAMRRAVQAFAERIEPGATVLFFFGGYGIQVAQSIYVVPVDADIWNEKDVVARSLALGEIMAAFEGAGAKAKLVVLDASRRNPFERRFRTLSMGLGPTTAPEGSLLLSSAGVGEVVDDGDGETSIFISELVKEMRAPDLTAQEIFNRTRIGVARATNGAQRPFVLSTLAEDVTLGPSRGAPSPDQPANEPSPSIGMPAGEPTPGLVFRDCSRCPDVVVIAPGEFTMGSDAFETEAPAHRAVIATPFAMGRSEVTFAQWDACVADGGCAYHPSDQGRGRTMLPVGEVSWRDAVAYVDWLTRVSGHKYRLPTETEWEYAARGGTATAYWWGDDLRAGFANCRGCGGDGDRQSVAAGSFPANPFGLVDTAGNVAEWVEDCWTESYRDASTEAVAGATAPVGDCKQRIVRGGSFDAGPRYLRSSSRFPYDPDLRYDTNGVRVLRELPRAAGR